MTAQQQIWMNLFQQFLERGVHSLNDLYSLNGFVSTLHETFPSRPSTPPQAIACIICGGKGSVLIDSRSDIGICLECEEKVKAAELEWSRSHDESVLFKPFDSFSTKVKVN